MIFELIQWRQLLYRTSGFCFAETLNGAQRRRTVSFSGSLRKKSREDVEDNVALQPESASVEEHFSQQSNESFEVQARRKHSIYSFTSDLPDSALKVRAL